MNTDVEIAIEPAKVIRLLTAIVSLMTLAGLTSTVLRFKLGYQTALGFVPKFDLNEEHNIPTYFAAVLLLLAFVLLSVIATVKKRQKAEFKKRQKAEFANHWRLLAFIFLYMSLDEAAGIHEMVGSQIRRIFRPEGILHFSWVIPGTILVLFLGFLFRNFLINLPVKTRRLFSIAAAIYIGGALGFEFIEGYYFEPLGNFLLSFLAVVEETLEMIGIMLFIGALLEYLGSTVGVLKFRIEGKNSA